MIPVRKNKISLIDSFLQLGLSTEEHIFYDKSAQESRQFSSKSLPLNKQLMQYYSVEILFAQNQLTHERKIYGFLDVLGDFGGVAQVLETIAAFILAPIATHAYLSKAISKLYVAKTEDRRLFLKKRSQKSDEQRKKVLALIKQLPK